MPTFAGIGELHVLRYGPDSHRPGRFRVECSCPWFCGGCVDEAEAKRFGEYHVKTMHESDERAWGKPVAATSLEDEVIKLREQLDALQERVRLSAVAERFIAGNHEIRDDDNVRFSDGHVAHVHIASGEIGKWTFTDRQGRYVEPFRVPPEDGIERLYTIAEVAEILAKVKP
jgi:hypothetical protein